MQTLAKPRLNYCLYLVIFILASFSIGCSNEHHTDRLQNVYDLTESNPVAALDSLSCIDYTSLSSADRYYYDLITIKASDKQYSKHTTDSVIIKLINYYEHDDTYLYPEALYYAGRVYSDIGDYPTALQYFQQALDCIPKNDQSLKLRGNILAQIGGLMNRLRMYRQAIPYLQEVIHFDSISRDTFNLAYDLRLLGSIHLHLKEYEHAETLFIKARNIATNLEPKDKAHMETYLAAVKYLQGDIVSAKNIIQPLPKLVNSVTLNTTLAYAADIYRKAGQPDSALFYASLLINDEYINNRRNGYRIMLSPEVSYLIPKDSILPLIHKYYYELEDYFNRLDGESVISQNSQYNYSIHLREREKAERKSKELIIWLFGVCLLTCISVIWILILRSRNQHNLIKLHNAFKNIDCLKKIINQTSTKERSSFDMFVPLSPSPAKTKQIDELREKLRSEILTLNQTCTPPPLAKEFIESTAYQKLITYINEEKTISTNNPIWDELKSALSISYPNFFNNLRIILREDLDNDAQMLCILIKCAIPPSKLSLLIGRNKSTISYRRRQLCIKCFGCDVKWTDIDNLIKLI